MTVPALDNVAPSNATPLPPVLSMKPAPAAPPSPPMILPVFVIVPAFRTAPVLPGPSPSAAKIVPAFVTSPSIRIMPLPPAPPRSFETPPVITPPTLLISAPERI